MSRKANWSVHVIVCHDADKPGFPWGATYETLWGTTARRVFGTKREAEQEAAKLRRSPSWEGNPPRFSVEPRPLLALLEGHCGERWCAHVSREGKMVEKSLLTDARQVAPVDGTPIPEAELLRVADYLDSVGRPARAKQYRAAVGRDAVFKASQFADVVAQ